MIISKDDIGVFVRFTHQEFTHLKRAMIIYETAAAQPLPMGEEKAAEVRKEISDMNVTLQQVKIN